MKKLRKQLRKLTNKRPPRGATRNESQHGATSISVDQARNDERRRKYECRKRKHENGQ